MDIDNNMPKVVKFGNPNTPAQFPPPTLRYP